MVSSRGKKRKVKSGEEAIEQENAKWWVRGDIWYEDGSVVLLTTGNIGFKVS